MMVVALLLGPVVALVVAPGEVNAALVNASNGLINDTTQNLTWVSDANLFQTQAIQSGDATAFVNTIVSDASGLFTGYVVTAGDFSISNVLTNNPNGVMDWWAAQAWVHYLNVTNFKGYSNWRLPTTVQSLSSIGFPDGIGSDPGPSSSEMAHLFYTDLGQVAGSSVGSNPGLFINVQASSSNSAYWSGTTLEPYNAFLFSPWNGYQGNSFSLNGIAYAMVVRDGQVPIPPPVSQQLAALLKEVTGVGPGKSLANKVELAQTYYAAKDVQATCAMLTAFVNEVEAQAGKKIGNTLDAKLIADANAIEDAIGCQ